MVPPFSEAHTAEIVHALSRYGTIEMVVTLLVLSTVMFLLGFAISKSLADSPKIHITTPGHVVTPASH